MPNENKERKIRLDGFGEADGDVGRENRLEFRQPIAFAAYHRLVSSPEKPPEIFWGLTTIKNISLSGILFMSNVPYKVNDVLEMKLEPSDVEYSFVFGANVIRVKEQVPGSLYYIAVTIHPGDRDNIKKILFERSGYEYE